jgi:hypothetical protein
MADLKPQLLNRAWRESPRISAGQRGPRHLWDHKANPPQQASIIVYADGTCLEGWDFMPWEYDNSSPEQKDVLAFIPGGYYYECVDGPVHDILVANGFECGYAANYDTYLEKYTAKYPYGAGPIPQDQASARMRAKLARIAKLEAELNELRGSL